jgi:hypothetical protein
MKKGDKYINKKTRHVVTIVGSYNTLGRIVVNYRHCKQSDGIGAKYLADFKASFRPKTKG